MKKELNKAKKGQVAVRLIFLSVATFFVATALAITAVSAATWVGPAQPPPLDNLSGFINNTIGGGSAQTANFNITGSGIVGTNLNVPILSVSQDATIGGILTTGKLCFGSDDDPANCKTSWPASDPNAGQWALNANSAYIYNQNASVDSGDDAVNAQEVRAYNTGKLQVYGANDWLEFQVNNAQQYSEIRWGDDVGDRLRFYFWASGAQDREVMNLLSNGNVGIGTASPATVLEVATSNSHAFPTSGTGNLSTLHSVVKINNKDASAKAVGLSFAVDTELIDQGDISLVSNADDAIGSRFAFRLRSDPNAWGEKFSILSSGNVGVGDITPLSLFTVGDGDKFRIDSLGNAITTGKFFIGANPKVDTYALQVVTSSDNIISYGIYATTTANNVAYGIHSTADTKRAGGWTASIGVYGAGRGNSASKFGVYGLAEGSNTNYALYSNASGGTTNWGLYVAAGNSYFAGNVGIGVTAPLAKLQIAASSITEPALLISQASTGNIFQALDGSATVFVIKDGGNVGIGPGIPNILPFPTATTAPGTTLSVNDPDAGDMARVNIVADWPMFGIVETGFGSVPDNRIFAIQMNNGVIKMGSQTDASIVKNNLLEFDLAAGTTNLGGKVGINTASPSGKLHVYSDTATAGPVNRALHVEAMGTGNETNIAIRGEAQAGTSFNSFGGFFVGGLYADRICLGSVSNCITSWPTGSGSNTSGWTDDGTYVRLQTATDNVGIGTNSPLAKLHVQGAGTGNVLLGAWSANSAYGSIYLNGSTVASNYNFLSSPSDTNLYINRPSGKVIAFREANGGTANMTIAAGGNVGININSPSYKLDVNGITNLRSSVGLDIRTKICTNLVTCTCDSGYIILSGGARCTSGFNPQLSRSYPLSLTTWEAQCAFGQSFDIYLTCVKGFDNS